MTAVLVDVANAVVTDLNLDPSTNFGVSFTAAMSYADFDEKLHADFTSLQCDVVPIGYLRDGSQELGNRLAIENEVETHVALRKKLTRGSSGTLTVADVSALVTALEKIRDFFVMRELTTYTAASYLDAKVEAAYVREHLRQYSQYTGLVRLTHRCVVTVPEG